MKKALFLIGIMMVVSCKKDDSRSCTTCSSPETAAFEICRESNGNASVNGQDTGTDYDVYISGLEDAGATCGGVSR
ncbi:MAG TPA: hypothetical protein PKW08_00495 [Flavobacteriaceae bacterium]|nr:hypothetical protein [Flavobacteriaceae bacterium]MCB9211963.1 hypothetical protein [Alteromonas sp.]HPF09943.1 hypothetical protein [Flavobacteriaceae bacterium]HQU20040.1 hypothetical protein [Flavobacteriaceae bacterium]HQU63974.1 hypothetical protein [Flavobacteriaceae bacterium]